MRNSAAWIHALLAGFVAANALGAPAARAAGPAAQAPSAEVQALLDQRKYRSAFEALNRIDPRNERAEIYAQKIDISLGYYLTCINSDRFSLKDLAPGEEIAALRGKPGAAEVFALDVEKEAPALLAAHPGDGHLAKAVGDWYFHGTHGCGLDPRLRPQARLHYERARELGVGDAKMFQNLGVLYLEAKDNQGAIDNFRAALARDDTSADAHYDLALAEGNLKQFDSATREAQRAVDLYTDPELQSEAALLAAITALEAGDRASALRLGAAARSFRFRNPAYILGKLLGMYIKAGAPQEARQLADAFFALDPTNPKMMQDILKAYADPAQADELRAFFDRNLLKFEQARTAHGNLQFHCALFLERSNDRAGAAQRMRLAREDFSADAKANEAPLRVIDAYLKDAQRAQ